MRFKDRLMVAATACVLVCALVLSGCLCAPAHAQDPAPHARPRRASDLNAPPPSAKQTPDKNTTAQADEDVEHVETNLVNVLFNAVDKDRHFVTTLKPEDIRIYEDNVPQQIANFERATELPLSLALLMDVSRSQLETLSDEKDAAHIFVESLVHPATDKVAVLSFTGDAVIEQDLTGDTAALQRAINDMEIVMPPDDQQAAAIAAIKARASGDRRLPGSTAVWDAIWATTNEIMAHTPERMRRAIILVSDGDDTTSVLKREDAVDAALKTSTIIYAIGIEPLCDDCPFRKKELRHVAEQTGGRAFFPKSDAELRAAFAQIQLELRTQYLVSYVPTNRTHDGTFRTVRIEVVNRDWQKQKLALSYRGGYYANPPAPSAGNTPRPRGQHLSNPPWHRKH
jgi:Ca-activated chloride channel homolog